jgi:predicted transcriptional regulator
MNGQTKTVILPQVRIEPSLKERLERIARRSVSPSLSDHIRYAVVQYVESEELRQQPEPSRN